MYISTNGVTLHCPLATSRNSLEVLMLRFGRIGSPRTSLSTVERELSMKQWCGELPVGATHLITASLTTYYERAAACDRLIGHFHHLTAVSHISAIDTCRHLNRNSTSTLDTRQSLYTGHGVVSVESEQLPSAAVTAAMTVDPAPLPLPTSMTLLLTVRLSFTHSLLLEADEASCRPVSLLSSSHLLSTYRSFVRLSPSSHRLTSHLPST